MQVSAFGLGARLKIVLGILAALAISGFIVLQIFIQGQRYGAAEVNLSGQQRMLSQRIVALTLKLTPGKDDTENQVTLEHLGTAVETMAASHRSLTQGDPELGLSAPNSEALRALYFGPEKSVDADVKAFLTTAKELLGKNLSIEDYEQKRAALLAFDAETLLHDLNLIVAQYQKQNEAKIETLGHYQAGTVLVTLCALLASWIIVFKPMAERLNHYIGEIFSQARSVKQSENRLIDAQKLAKLAHWSWDIQNDEIIISDDCLKLLGRDSKDWKATPKSFAEGIFEPDFQVFRQNIKEGVETGQPIDMDIRYYYGGDRDDLRWLHLRCNFEGRKNGPARQMLGIAQDISDQKNLETSLIAAKEEAELANRAKTTFLANMSHELRTPLNAIIGFSEIMQGEMLGPLGSDTYKDYTADIYRSGKHLLDIIGDLLDVSKIEAGKLDIHCEDIDISQILSNCIIFYGNSTKANKLNIEVDIPKDFPALSADPTRVKQIAMNLISNSIKHTPSGGKINVTARLNGHGTAKIIFTDTGCGIPQEDIPHITRPFFQTGDIMTTPQDGSGLGLYIVNALVHLHNGSMDIKSEVGKGTSVTIELPLSHV